MRNFDYIQSLGVTDLRRYCSAIERSLIALEQDNWAMWPRIKRIMDNK